MHKLLNKYYCFIEKYQSELVNNLPKNSTIIYRNYQKRFDLSTIIKLKKICKKKNFNFILSNNIKLAIKLNLDGAYIPSFNKNLTHNCFQLKKNFKLLGSAHNLKEIRIKEDQNVNFIFLSPLFKTSKYKYYLGIYRFLKLTKLTKKDIVSLGGINKNNLKKLKLLNNNNIASISMFQNLLNHNAK